MKLNKILAMVSLTSVFLLGIGLTGCGNEGGTTDDKTEETVYTMDENQIDEHIANNKVYNLDKIKQKESVLKGKTIYWLGSSVTVGQAAVNLSMADYLAARTGCISVKEAVSGTTILEDGDNHSYTYRIENGTNFDKNAKVDAFICQISTNDAKKARLSHRGEITGSTVTEISAFDKTTTLGGVEYIIAYASSVWHCPVYFYSGAHFDDEGTRGNADPSGTDYGQLIDEVKEVANKWNAIEGYTVEVLDLFNDSAFNALATDKYYKWGMNDPIHPRKAAYLQWWMPAFDKFLSERFGA